MTHLANVMKWLFVEKKKVPKSFRRFVFAIAF